MRPLFSFIADYLSVLIRVPICPDRAGCNPSRRAAGSSLSGAMALSFSRASRWFSSRSRLRSARKLSCSYPYCTAAKCCLAAKTNPPASTKPQNNNSASRDSALVSRLRRIFAFCWCSGNLFIAISFYKLEASHCVRAGSLQPRAAPALPAGASTPRQPRARRIHKPVNVADIHSGPKVFSTRV